MFVLPTSGLVEVIQAEASVLVLFDGDARDGAGTGHRPVSARSKKAGGQKGAAE